MGWVLGVLCGRGVVTGVVRVLLVCCWCCRGVAGVAGVLLVCGSRVSSPDISLPMLNNK